MVETAADWRRETQRAGAIIKALLAEATRVGHSGKRTFVSTIVETDVLQDAYAFLDDRAETEVGAPSRAIAANVVSIHALRKGRTSADAP